MKKEELQGLVKEVFEAEFKGSFDHLQQLMKDSRAEKSVAEELAALTRKQSLSRESLQDPEKIARAHLCVRMIRCLAAAKGDKNGAIQVAKDESMGELVVKALGTTTIAGGGALIDEEFSSDLVDLLRNRTVVMELGARTIDMPTGASTFPRVTAGATAAYRGESTNATYSNPTLGEVNPRAHILDVAGSMSNQLLRRADSSADEFLRTDLEAAARVKQDATFLRSAGTSFEPRGMLYWAQAANKFNAANVAATADGSTLAEIIGDLATALQTLADNNIRMIRPGWAISNRIWRKLFTLRDSGFWVFKEEMNQGKLFGIPFANTAQIPNNLGSGTDESEVYLADFFDLVMYNTMNLNVRMSDTAAYHDGSNVVAAFSRDETVVQVSLEHDFISRRVGAEIVVIEDVRWGA